MLVLGIESTCDETACAIVRDGKEILANVVASQMDLHREYGGVVPELACRRHIDMILPVLRQALDEASVKLCDLDLIAVAHGPGLIGALLIGMNAAKGLALGLNKPFVGVNHVEAHLYAAMMSHPTPITFPALGIVLSGGHTSLVKIEDLGRYTLLGETVDDAVGEAFDKVAKILGLPYPGGPQIEQLAKLGDPTRYALKAGHVKGRPLDFSFSGLKTGVLYTLKGQNSQTPQTFSQKEQCDLAASFQAAAFKDILEKTLQAAEKHACKTLIFGGGVTNNQTLRLLFAQKQTSLQILWPSAGLSLDNAAMIAGLGFHIYRTQGPSSLELEAATRISFSP